MYVPKIETYRLVYLLIYVCLVCARARGYIPLGSTFFREKYDCLQSKVGSLYLQSGLDIFIPVLEMMSNLVEQEFLHNSHSISALYLPACSYTCYRASIKLIFLLPPLILSILSPCLPPNVLCRCGYYTGRVPTANVNYTLCFFLFIVLFY